MRASPKTPGMATTSPIWVVKRAWLIPDEISAAIVPCVPATARKVDEHEGAGK